MGANKPKVYCFYGWYQAYEGSPGRELFVKKDGDITLRVCGPFDDGHWQWESRGEIVDAGSQPTRDEAMHRAERLLGK